jgi:GNAT superfamily N-acetyltransferase
MLMAADSTGPVRLTKAQIKPTAVMLARAFQDDPLFAYFLPDAVKRKEKLHHIFEVFIRYGVLYGEAYATSPNLEGATVWFPPGRAEMTLWRTIRCGGLFLYFKVGRKVMSRVLGFFDYAFKVHGRHAPFPHWYGAVLGVDPEFQGKGYMSALMKPILARIDQEHLPCYLETNSETNLPIHEHYGFEVVEICTVPKSDVTLWAMLRKKSS